MNNWLGLVIGNSRSHWAWFKDDVLVETWERQHLSTAIEGKKIPPEMLSSQLISLSLTELPIYLASVVPQQTTLWQKYPRIKQATLANINLENIYPTMGIDRALAIWGAGETYGYPCLVIDGGTALTFTGVNQTQQLVGGAILPGLRSQVTTLAQKTADLPAIDLSSSLPPRWSLETETAIASGVIYTVVAGIHSFIVDWCQQFPHSWILLTGGDSNLLSQYLQAQFPEIAKRIIVERHLIFWGLKLAFFSSFKGLLGSNKA